MSRFYPFAQRTTLISKSKLEIRATEFRRITPFNYNKKTANPNKTIEIITDTCNEKKRMGRRGEREKGERERSAKKQRMRTDREIVRKRGEDRGRE